MTDSEPTLTRAVLGGLIAGAVLIIVSRINRSIDLFNGDELEAFKTWLPLASGVTAGVLIRRKVTPTTQVQQHVDFGVAAGYAQGLQDAPPTPPAAPARARPARAAAKAPAKRRGGA